MKLTRIGKKPVEKKSPAPTGKIVRSAEAQYGKHAGKTIAWIEANDDNYYQWAKREGLLAKWSEYIPEPSEKKERVKERLWSPYISSTGEVWMGIRMTNTPTEPYKEI